MRVAPETADNKHASRSLKAKCAVSQLEGPKIPHLPPVAHPAPEARPQPPSHPGAARPVCSPVAPPGHKHLMEGELPVEVTLYHVQPLGVPRGQVQLLEARVRAHRKSGMAGCTVLPHPGRCPCDTTTGWAFLGPGRNAREEGSWRP